MLLGYFPGNPEEQSIREFQDIGLADSGNLLPAISTGIFKGKADNTPASATSHWKATPVASGTRLAASVTSGPIPSPGIRVTL